MTIKDGDKFVRQGFKFAMHAAQWTMIQFNPILLQSGGKWFDKSRKMHGQQRGRHQGDDAPCLHCAEVRRRGSRQLDRDQSDPGHGLPEGTGVDVLLPSAADQACVKAENPAMEAENYFRPVQYPGVQSGKGFSTTYGFNLVINGKASAEKQEALHDLYKFMMSDLVDAWKDAAPFTFAKKTGWADNPEVQKFPYVNEIIKAKDEGVFLPRSLVFNELANSMHRAVQKIMLSKADIKKTLDEAAAEVDRATAAYKKA